MAYFPCCRLEQPPDTFRLDPIRGTFAYPEPSPEVIVGGARIGAPAEASNLVIAIGNGITGYQSVEIDRTNRIEVRSFHGDNRRKVYAFEATFTGEPVLEQLLGAHPINNLYERYSTELQGGTGGFLIVLGSDGSVRVSTMKNYYPDTIRDIWMVVRSLAESIPIDKWGFVGAFSSVEIENSLDIKNIRNP